MRSRARHRRQPGRRRRRTRASSNAAHDVPTRPTNARAHARHPRRARAMAGRAASETYRMRFARDRAVSYRSRRSRRGARAWRARRRGACRQMRRPRDAVVHAHSWLALAFRTLCRRGDRRRLVVGDHFVELAARVEQTRSHGDRVRIDEIRDLLQIESFDLMQVQHDAFLWREHLERAIHALAIAAALETLLRRLWALAKRRIVRRGVEIGHADR